MKGLGLATVPIIKGDMPLFIGGAEGAFCGTKSEKGSKIKSSKPCTKGLLCKETQTAF